MLKVLQINKFLYPHQGGIESVSESIIEALEDTNLELFNICFSNNKDFPSRKNVKRFFSRFTFFSQPISLSYMLFIFRNLKKFDACIVHFPNVLALIALIFSKSNKIFIYWHSDIHQQNIVLRKLFYTFEKILIRRSYKIIFATDAHRTGSVHSFENEKSLSIPYTLNNEEAAGKTFTRRIQKRSNKENIIFIGRLVEYKGVAFLIKALKNMSFKLSIIGSGPLEEKLRQISKNQSNIKFLGRVDDLESIFETASMLILPSINKAEMFGIVQIEAFARGIPVISTLIEGSGVPLINANSLTGYLAKPGSDQSLRECLKKFDSNKDTFDSNAIRNYYLENFSNNAFKQNLIEALYSD